MAAASNLQGPRSRTGLRGRALEGALWLASGVASLFFLSWACLELVLIRRLSGWTGARRWFMAFLLAMVAFVLAGLAGAPGLLAGACLAVAGLALYEAAHEQRVAFSRGVARGR